MTRPKNTQLPTLKRKPLEHLGVVDAIIRVSRVNGRDGEQFMSPDQQRKAIQEWADRNGVTIRKWWDETDSVSGSTTNRAGLKGAMKACLAGKSNGIAVAKVDRFARNLPEGLAAVYKLRDAGKSFVAVRDGIEGDTARGTGKMLLTLLFMFAEWQLESLTDGWNSARERHIGNGVANIEPFGYRRDEATRKLVPYEPEAQWVRWVFEQRAEGASWTTMADFLTEALVPTARGGRWMHNTLCQLVANRVYLGELTSGDFMKVDAHPAIVTPKLWAKANRPSRTASSSRDRQANLGAGLVRCGTCGGRMRCRTTTIADVAYSHYRCRERYSWGVCPDPASAPAELVHQLLLDQFDADYGDVAIEPDAIDDDAAVQVALDELAEVEADLEDFINSPATAQMRRQVGQRFVDDGITTRMARIAEARDAVTAMRIASHGATMEPGVVRAWPNMDDEQRREHLSAAYLALVVWPSPIRERCSTIDGRVWIFRHGEPDAPVFPGRGVKDNAVTAIGRPAGL